MAAPRRLYFFTAVSSCCTARSGCWSASEAKATKRSGCAAHSSASFSFCSCTTLAARSRSSLYQVGLIESASISMPCSFIAPRRSSSTITCCNWPRVWPLKVSPCRAIAAGIAQCAWISMVLMRRPPTETSRLLAMGFCWAWAASSRQQPVKAMPAAPALVFKKSLRLVMIFSSDDGFFGGR